MVETINTSFIPQKITSSKRKNGGGSIDLTLFVSIVIFAIVVLATVGVFLYKNILASGIEDSAIMLEKEKDNFFF